MGNERCGSAAAATIMTGFGKVSLSRDLELVVIAATGSVGPLLVIGGAALLLADAAITSRDLSATYTNARWTHGH